MKNIIEYLIKYAKEIPKDYFCIDDDEKITFEDALKLAVNISNTFIKNGIINKPIMLRAERNCKTLIAILGVVLSNNYFVPVNDLLPEEKINNIVTSSNIEYEIIFNETKNEFEKDIKKFFYNEMIQTKADSSVLELLEKNFCEDNNLYAIYTSGSTGVPKGVLKTQKNAISYIENFLKTFKFEEKKFKIANQAPLFFDAAMKDLMLSLATGSTIFFPNKQLFSFPTKLIEYLNKNKINYISWVPSALTIIVRLNTFECIKPKYLKYVFFVGEVFIPKYLNIWIKELPNIEYYNIYGSTEIAGVCLYKKIDKILPEDKPIPIGRPLMNNYVYLVDGELIIQSNQVAKCYINDDEKNKKVFIEYNGKKALRTGDYAYVNENGDFVFITRKDFQVKHMGYRIELQEIEIAISSLNYISNCVVLFDEKKDNIISIVCFSDVFESPIKKILEDLKQKLPRYMIPNKVIILDDLPTNSNGKIDRVKLKKIYID